MTKHEFKRFGTWTDEYLWGQGKTSLGLVYGVYDHKLNKIHPVPNVVITSYKQANEEAAKLNAELEDPFTF